MMKSEHGRIDLLTKDQIDWCNKYCDFEWFVKDDGKVYSKYGDIYFKDMNLIISFPVRFGDCRYFTSSYCISLKSLEGAPKSINRYFTCAYCDSLESLKGAPEFVGKNFDCSYCKSLKSIDELKNTEIKEKIVYNDCPKLKKYDLILSDMNMFRRWQKSEYTADEFMKKWNGYFEAQKYGI